MRVTRNKIMIAILSIVVILFLGYIVMYYVSMRNVNEPAYSVIKQDGNIQIRDYQPMIIAEVITHGKREQAVNQGFRLLADYIFGNNTAPNDQNKIAMTAPVLQQQTNEKIAMTAPVLQSESANDTWQIKFVMPAKYTLQTLPKPNNKAVKIIQVPSYKALVIRFSGRITDNNIERYIQQIKQYIVANKINVAGNPQYAFYNPPWTLPFMRRNEIMYKIEKSTQKHKEI